MSVIVFFERTQTTAEVGKQPGCTVHGCALGSLCVFGPFMLLLSTVCFSRPLSSADVPPAGPADLPLSLLEMGCSGRFELVTRPMPGQPLSPQSTVSVERDDCGHLLMNFTSLECFYILCSFVVLFDYIQREILYFLLHLYDSFSH